MVAELISVGTEILLGNIVNTNASYLSRKCAELGLSLYYEESVGDNVERLEDTIQMALSRSDILILTGGLGPTKDDLTKEVTAKTLEIPLVTDEHTKERIKDYFAKVSHKKLTENNWKQGEIPEGAIVLDNDLGTAPGLIIETNEDKKIILLPGPPNEMIPMFESKVVPYLRKLQDVVIYSQIVKICGIGESYVESKIIDLIDNQSNPTIAPYAKSGEVHLRITARAENEEKAKKLIKPIVKELKSRFKENIYSLNEKDNLEDVIIKLLTKKELTITTAESCTGGLFTSKLINSPGCSEVFKEGFIAYSNKAKRKYLDVSKNTLKKYGAVSPQVAKEMARGSAILTDSDVSVSITGIAGPDGETDEKPIGLVYIACYANEKTVVKEFRFSGDRHKIRESSVVSALDLLRRCIIDNYYNRKD